MTEARERCPANVLEWIAWYPDQGLDDRQRGAVEAHAAGCAACRDEIAMLQGPSDPPLEGPDPDQLLARIWSRIEAAEAAPAPAQPPRAGRSAAPPARVPRRSSRRTAAVAAAALVLAAAAGAVAGALLLDDREPLFRAAAGAGPAGEGGGPALDVVFTESATASRIAAALHRIDGQIVAGPSPLGRYRVRLPSGGDPVVAARRLRNEGDDVALLAEPVVP